MVDDKRVEIVVRAMVEFDRPPQGQLLVGGVTLPEQENAAKERLHEKARAIVAALDRGF